MTTNRSRPSDGISRQAFLRGAVSVLATGAVFGTARATADPVTGWGVLASMQQFSVGGYVNYLNPNPSAARYFGSNSSRLTTVRQKYDPNQIMFSGLNF